MRIRSTKPEFWRSHTIAELSWEDRLVLKGLEHYVDDNGVGKDDVELICSEVFPRDTFRSPRETFQKVSEAISNFCRAGLIARYVANGEKLLYVDRWADLQRIDKPSRGRFPRPDGTMDYREPVSRESYRSTPETLASPPEMFAPGTGEQGNRGTGEKEKARTPVQTEPHSAEPEPTAAASATPGADLVRAIVPKTHPSATLTSLRLQASELLKTGTDADVVAEALRLWCDKPSIGNGRTILASLCSEAIKSRATPSGANGKPHKLRALADLAAEVRAAEVLEMETANRKAIQA